VCSSDLLVLWNTEEFSFVSLPDAFATGSSIMPQKKNPDVPELVRGKAGGVFGNLVALLALIKGLPLAYNRDLQEDKPLVFNTADTLKASLSVMAELVPRLKFNTDRMRQAAAGGYSTATDMAEHLVRKGMPFREAHEATGRVVAYCIEKGKGLDALSLAELKGFSRLFDKDVLGVLGVEASVRSRASLGGTAPKEVGRQIKRLKALLAK
jgi:argininosuccinate lyase